MIRIIIDSSQFADNIRADAPLLEQLLFYSLIAICRPDLNSILALSWQMVICYVKAPVPASSDKLPVLKPQNALFYNFIAIPMRIL